jgi:hypothetical protein
MVLLDLLAWRDAPLERADIGERRGFERKTD